MAREYALPLLSGSSNSRSLRAAYPPAVLALLYPAFIDLFHAAVGNHGAAVSAGGVIVASAMMLLMLSVPAIGLIQALRLSHAEGDVSPIEIRARRFAYATIAAPTLYTFLGVLQALVSSPVPDEVSWAALWAIGILWYLCAPLAPHSTLRRPRAGLRVAHGLTALIVLMFVMFHLTNHLFAWEGQAAHAAVMNMGRTVYRSAIGEPILVVAMLFQAASGLLLAWRWSAHRSDGYRTFQIGSGFYLAVYILGHMNSVFVYARAYLGIQTGWDFATGAPNGLIHDPWSVRLIPHYALGVFFLVGHVFSGLRVVLIAHDRPVVTANRLWRLGTLAGAMLALLIILAMCGLRVPAG